MRRGDRARGTSGPAPRIPRAWIVATVVFLLLVVLGIAMWRSVLSREEQRAIQRQQQAAP